MILTLTAILMAVLQQGKHLNSCICHYMHCTLDEAAAFELALHALT